MAEYSYGRMNGSVASNKTANGTCRTKSGKRTAEKLQFINSKEKTDSKVLSFFSTAWFVMECLFCYAVLLPVAFFLVPVGVVFFLLKVAERMFVQNSSGGIPLSGQDSFWKRDRKENLMVISGLLHFEIEHDFDKTLAAFREGILDRMVNSKHPNGESMYPRSRYIIRPGYFQYFFHEDKSFRIENHILKWEGDAPSTKEELEALVSKISSENLPENRPPWLFWCIPTNYGPKEMAVVFRMSHCIADGVSLVRFIISQLADEANVEREPRKFSSSHRLLHMAKALLATPRCVVGRLLVFSDKSIVHGPKICGTKKVVWLDGLDLKTIKRIKNAADTTVNDVLMSCFSLALRTYFLKKGVQQPDDFTASIPVDIRSAACRKVEKFENKFAIIFLKLPVGTDGVLQQLYETKARMDEVKLSGDPLGMAAAVYVTAEFLPEFLTHPFHTYLTEKASCVLSNVPGPQHLLKVNGITLKFMTFWPPQRDNIAVGLSIYTYGGKVIVGVQCDVAVLPDPEIITEEFGNAVKNMAKCVLHDDDDYRSIRSDLHNGNLNYK